MYKNLIFYKIDNKYAIVMLYAIKATLVFGVGSSKNKKIKKSMLYVLAKINK